MLVVINAFRGSAEHKTQLNSQNKQKESVWNTTGSRAQLSYVMLLMKLDLYEIDGLLCRWTHSARRLVGCLEWQSASSFSAT